MAVSAYTDDRGGVSYCNDEMKGLPLIAALWRVRFRCLTQDDSWRFDVNLAVPNLVSTGSNLLPSGCEFNSIIFCYRPDGNANPLI